MSFEYLLIEFQAYAGCARFDLVAPGECRCVLGKDGSKQIVGIGGTYTLAAEKAFLQLADSHDNRVLKQSADKIRERLRQAGYPEHVWKSAFKQS